MAKMNNNEGGYECEFVEKAPECYKASCKSKNISIVGRDSDNVHFLWEPSYQEL